MGIPEGNEWGLADQWANVTRSAFESLAKADFRRAAEIWSESEDRVLIAASMSGFLACANGALGHLLAGHDARACAGLERADAILASLVAAASNEASLAGTSTGHHVRLVSKHGAAFAGATARRSAELQAVMQTLVRFHRSLVVAGACLPRCLEDVRAALTRAFGPSSPDVALMAATDSAEIAGCYALKAARLESLLSSPAAWGRQRTELLASAVGLVTPAMLDLAFGMRASSARRKNA